MGETSREAYHTYFKAKQDELEVALSTAVRAAVSGLHPDPILFVSEHLAAAAARVTGGGGDIASGAAGGAAQSCAPAASALPVTAAHVAEVVGKLRFTPSYDSQHTPTRPSAEELAEGATSSGPVVYDGGIVVQGGPASSLWLRIGCVDHPHGYAPLSSPVMDWVRGFVEHLVAMLQQGGGTGAGPVITTIYCAVALRASSASTLIAKARARDDPP